MLINVSGTIDFNETFDISKKDYQKMLQMMISDVHSNVKKLESYKLIESNQSVSSYNVINNITNNVEIYKK